MAENRKALGPDGEMSSMDFLRELFTDLSMWDKKLELPVYVHQPVLGSKEGNHLVVRGVNVDAQGVYIEVDEIEEHYCYGE